jgi:DNA-binding transcriptional MerR regulator
MTKTAEAFRTISEVAGELDVPKHVLRFWEGRFPQIRPMKRGGGRRYYRPEDLALLRGICHLLHAEGYTIKGVQKILREQGVDHVKQVGTGPSPNPNGAETPKSKGRARTAKSQPAPYAVTGSADKGTGARARRTSSSAIAPDLRTQIQTAIGELEVCRSLLLGKAIESTARRRVAKSRRAARH